VVLSANPLFIVRLLSIQSVASNHLTNCGGISRIPTRLNVEYLMKGEKLTG